MKKILKIADPYITSLQYHAFFTCVILSKKHNINYILNNYIDIAIRSLYNPHIDFLYEGLLNHNSSPLSKIHIRGKVDNIIDFIIESIINDCYISTNIDEYFLPNRTFYLKKSFVHDILIFGYDSDKKIFYTFGYDTSNQLAISEVSFDNIEKAYSALKYEWD